MHPLSERVRAVGLAPGDKIACMARVTRTNPLLLSASDWGCFGGSLAEFRRYAVEMEPSLEDFAVVLSVFVAYAAAAVLAGACLMLRDRWRARRKARANAPHTSSGPE